MSIGRSRLLLVLVMVAAVATALGHARLSRTRAAALRAQQDLRTGQRQLDDLHRWRSGAAAAQPADFAPDTSSLNRSLRAAAVEAGAAEKLVGIEPGQVRSDLADSNQLPVFLRLEAISLKELTMFLHRLGSVDSSSRAQSIELAPAASDSSTELWNADVTVVYLNFSPAGSQP